jgi:hypothetical protein
VTEERQYERGTAPFTCGLQVVALLCVLAVLGLAVWRIFFA